mgnify:FL=1
MFDELLATELPPFVTLYLGFYLAAELWDCCENLRLQRPWWFVSLGAVTALALLALGLAYWLQDWAARLPPMFVLPVGVASLGWLVTSSLYELRHHPRDPGMDAAEHRLALTIAAGLALAIEAPLCWWVLQVCAAVL